MRKMILAFAILLLLLSGCTQEEKPKETAAPAATTAPPSMTVAPTTQAPVTTAPPTTQPPAATQPPTTAAPTTTAPPVTTAPPPAKILETYDVAVTEDSNLYIFVTGKVRNNGNEYQFDVKVIETLYDEFGLVKGTFQSVPVDKLAPGQNADFKITSNVLKSLVKKYTLEAVSKSIAPAATTPPPQIKELEVISVVEGINPNGQLTLAGKIKNTGTKVHFNVQVVVTLKDVYGNVMKTEKTAYIDKISPGEAKDFAHTSSIIRENIKSYTLEAVSERTSA